MLARLLALQVALLPWSHAAAPAPLSGCPRFAPGGVYNEPVTNAPVDPRSAQYVASMISAGNVKGFNAWTPATLDVNVATDATPLLSVYPKVRWHSFSTRVPWSPGFRIQPLGDAHAIVLQKDTCHLYELYQASYSAGVLSAYSGADWDLAKPLTALPPGTSGSTASGLPLLAGAVTWGDIEAGVIDHALDWGAPAGSVAQWSYVSPASDTDGIAYKGISLFRLPYGAHLRLKASFDIAGFPPQARIIAQAMKTYGVVLYDTGCCNAIPLVMPEAGKDPWDSADLAALNRLRISDFEVLRLPPIQRVPGH